MPAPDPASRLAALRARIDHAEQRARLGDDTAADYIEAQGAGIDAIAMLIADLRKTIDGHLDEIHHTQDRIDEAAKKAVERANADARAAFAPLLRQMMADLSRKAVYATMAGSVALVILVGAGAASVGWHYGAAHGAAEVRGADAELRGIAAKQGVAAIAWWRGFMALNSAASIKAQCQGAAVWKSGGRSACQIRAWVPRP